MKQIQKIMNESLALHHDLLSNDGILDAIEKTSNDLVETFTRGNKILLCGNGGSAADAQHIAAELTGRFLINRKPLPAEALHVNTSYLTAVANDYSFAEVFSRLVTANGKPGDALIAISTSGNSVNIVKAIETANGIPMTTIGLTNSDGGKMPGICKHIIRVPSLSTPRIQEIHILIGHIICEIVEDQLFGNKS